MPFVLCTMGLVVLFLAGCRKEEKKASAIPASSPASYMNDPAFMKKLAEKRDELRAIVKERKPLADRMQQLVKEHGEDLAALQKIPEWNELYKKVTALNKKYEEVRARQLKVVRERISPDMKRSGDRFPDMKRSGDRFPDMKRSGDRFPDMKRSGDHFPDMKRSGDRFPVQSGEAVSRPLQNQKDISK